MQEVEVVDRDASRKLEEWSEDEHLVTFHFIEITKLSNEPIMIFTALPMILAPGILTNLHKENTSPLYSNIATESFVDPIPWAIISTYLMSGGYRGYSRRLIMPSSMV